MDLRNLFNKGEDVQEYPAGTVIFPEGAPAEVMYVVIDGEVEISVGNTLRETIASGDIVGEMALIDAKPRSATAIAKSDCRLALLDEKRFQFMVQQTPFFSLHIMRLLVAKLRRMNAGGESES